VTAAGSAMLVNRLEESNAVGSMVAVQAQCMTTMDKLGQLAKAEAAIVVTEVGIAMPLIPDK